LAASVSVAFFSPYLIIGKLQQRLHLGLEYQGPDLAGAADAVDNDDVGAAAVGIDSNKDEDDDGGNSNAMDEDEEADTHTHNNYGILIVDCPHPVRLFD
jgi:hypothetical protein